MRVLPVASVLLLTWIAGCSSGSGSGPAGGAHTEGTADSGGSQGSPGDGADSGGAASPDGGGTGAAADGSSESGPTKPDGHAGSDAGSMIDSGSPPPPGASIEGTIAGQPVGTTDTMAVVTSFHDPPTGMDTSYLGVSIVDYAGQCALSQANLEKGSATELDVDFYLENANDPGNAPPIAPGTYAYDVSNANGFSAPDANGDELLLQVFYDVIDDTCHLPNAGLFATQGTVTISAVTASAVIGGFDLDFPNGDHLTGTFNSPRCDLSGVADAGEPTCQP